MTQHLEEVSDFYRYGLKAWLEMTSAQLEGAQRLRKQQLAAIGSSLSSFAGAAAGIEKAKGVEELLALQAQLLRTQFESVTGYWVGMSQLAGDNHVEMTKRAQVQAQQFLEKFHNTIWAVSNGSVPVMAALQPMVDATSSVYALAARATEETAKRGATQWATSDSNVKQPSEQSRRKAA